MGQSQSRSHGRSPSPSAKSPDATGFDKRSDEAPPPPYERYLAAAPQAPQPQYLSPYSYAGPRSAAPRGHPFVAAFGTSSHRRSASANVPRHRQTPAIAAPSPRAGSEPSVVQLDASMRSLQVLVDTHKRLSVPEPHRRPVSAPPRQPAVRNHTTPVPSSTSSSTAPADDPLFMLKKYDTIVIVDDSASMEGERWRETRDALAGVVQEAAKFEINGIDIHFLNDRRIGLNVTRASEITNLFKQVAPTGYTPTGEKLEELLLAYMLKIEGARALAASGDTTGPVIKPVNFIVLTDGAPSDDPETVIVAAARRLDAQHFPSSQVGIQFVQIGADPIAAASLHELDNALASAHNVRDMVDTTLYTGTLTSDILVKILLGGINRRYDREAPAMAAPRTIRPTAGPDSWW